MDIVLTDKDIEKVREIFPQLNCEVWNGRIWGTLDFCCWYDSGSRELEHNSQHRGAISDSYEIEIEFDKKDLFGFPKVYETSGRILKFSTDSKLELEDLHINKNDCNSCCLGIFPQYRWQGAADFILKKVVPFFYWQSHRRIKGEEPWEGHAHGDRGIEDALALVSHRGKGKNRNALCYCNSGKKYKKCCYQKDLILRSNLLKVKKGRRPTPTVAAKTFSDN